MPPRILRRDVVADGEHEGQERADHDARQGQRQDDVDEGPERTGAEVGGGLAVARRKLLQAGEDREREQHDEEMHEADNRGGAGVGELHRLGEQPGPRQRAVDDAVFRQHEQPAVGAHHIGGPERQHGQHQRQPLQTLWDNLGQDPGEGVGEHHRDHRYRQGHFERIDHGAPVARIAEELPVVFKRRAAAALFQQAQQAHGEKRNDEEADSP